jgi:hypothetical protein
MILVRTVFRAHFGRGGELAALLAASNPAVMAEMRSKLGTGRHWRLLTDLDGDFDTIVLETEAESLAEWEQVRKELFGLGAFQEAMAGLQQLVVSGRNELWSVEAEG